VYHRGGGVKRSFRILNYKNYIWNLYGLIYRIEYDPNRNCFINLIVYTNGILVYNINIQDLYVGDKILNSKHLINKNGYSTILSSIPVKTKISCIELSNLCGAQILRAAGMYCTIFKHLKFHVVLRLKNNRYYKVKNNNMALIGVVSNFYYMFEIYYKAGYNRRMGWRPTVRGVAKNPIDHPHGGGQGKTSGGRPSVTPWGKITKGKPTVKYKNFYYG